MVKVYLTSMARPLEFDRCEALQKAREVFQRSGYEAASIDELTQALGISRASLYNSFGDKHGLMLATLDAACQQDDELRSRTNRRRCSAKTAIREMLESLAASDAQGSFLLTLGAELSTSDPDVQRRVQATLEANRALFADILTKEDVYTPKQIETKAAALLGSMVAILTLRRVHPDPTLLQYVLQHALTVLY